MLAQRYAGLYLDANAISPAHGRGSARGWPAAGASFVDGGIVGGPAWQPDSTWLYLSGQRAAEAAALFRRRPA